MTRWLATLVCAPDLSADDRAVLAQLLATRALEALEKGDPLRGGLLDFERPGFEAPVRPAHAGRAAAVIAAAIAYRRFLDRETDDAAAGWRLARAVRRLLAC